MSTDNKNNDTDQIVSQNTPITTEYDVSESKIDEFFQMANEDAFAEVIETEEDIKRKKRIFKGKKRNRKEEASGGLISGIAKAVLYVVFILLCSGFLSYFIVTAGNDVFALVKTTVPAPFTVTADDDYITISEKLKESGAVEYDWLFKMFVIFQADDTDSIKFLEGEYKLESGLNYTQLFNTLTTVPYVRTEIRITVPEGFTTEQILQLLESEGISTREELIDVINNYPFKHEFVQLLEAKGYSKDRLYRLEGYLYPDTYYFYKDDSAVSIINKFLNNFDTKFWDEYEDTYKETCEKLGLTFDEIISLASIVQMEGITLTDFENISKVFHNRMKSNTLKKLESCATVQYILEERHEIITEADTKIDNPYNTYMYEGLPPGAICNPGINAIEATIFPAFDEQMLKDNNIKTAYFFVSDLAGNIYYAETQKGHEKNKAKADKINEQILNGEYVEEEDENEE